MMEIVAMRPAFIRFSVGLLVVVGVQQAVFAWKPKTHVFLADQAVDDALDDGKVTIFEVDPVSNTLKRDASGAVKEIGRYAVDPRILEAVRANRAHYRAGVLGPDAFPDILTGQQIIHPAKEVTPGETNVDLNPGGPGSDAWMKHLWRVAYEQDGTADSTPAARAFVAGFLAHAAGDMYGHTFVNYYTGDAFHFSPQPLNAIRHIVLEDYIAKRTPEPSYDSRIDAGVDEFIYRHMINGSPGSPVESLLSGANIDRTIAGNYSKLRNKLQDDRDDYYSRNLFDRNPLLLPLIEYEKPWIEDIDRGLRKLPGVSHRLAVALMYNPTGKMNTDEAKDILREYVQSHLLSMSGGPDFVGQVLTIMDDILRRLGVPYIKALIDEIKMRALDYFVEKATGVSVTDFKQYLEDSENQFDPVMDRAPLPNGHRTTKVEFDRQELKLGSSADARFEYTLVPPAYNTVVMVKLSLMRKDEVDRLMADLGSSERLTEPNAMLGFAASLDGSNQWRMNTKKMIVARHAAGYKRIFMKQNGENRYSLGVRYALGPSGSRVVFVKDGAAADGAGLKTEDTITKIAGKAVGVADYRTDVVSDVLWEATTRTITLEYLSNGVNKSVEVVLDID